MTHITTLQITDFRNLPTVNITPGPCFNIFYGNNGTGKTSILEAIYYFGFGRSFRTSNISRLIRETCDRFSLYSQLSINDSNVSIGIERTLDGNRRLRQNGENIKSIASIAECLPIQLICTDSYRFFHDGPKTRRQFMNWGLFHVEPAFFPLWQRLLQLLKQRNAALKSRHSRSEISIWTNELIDLADKIDNLRQDYVKQLQPLLEDLISKLLETTSLEIEYNPGWDISQGLEAALNQSYFKDQALGYTSRGPHRADLQLRFSGVPAKDILSQGQQKLASYALLLAQGQLLHQKSKSPIYLIDDLPSELDSDKRSAVTNVLKALGAQVFITGIAQQELSQAIAFEKSQLFHVKQNQIIDIGDVK